MCGIAGYYGHYDRSLLVKMANAIRHRGPDGIGEITLRGCDNANVGLAHTRLAIIDLSKHGHQPMTVSCQKCQEMHADKNQQLWLTYNGELYNYKTLKYALEQQGHVFHSNSDSEVLLHLYRQYSTDMLDQLNGIFAFAIYDGKNGDLFVARDPLGVKPFYYVSIPTGFLFASELKSILMHAQISRELDPIAIDHYLTYLWCPAPRTMLRAVKKLAPGFAMIIHTGKIIRHWQYYDIPFHQTSFKNTFNETATMLADQVKQAVQRQLIADVPVGAFLSGGLDSSAIVAMMRQLQPETPIDCYTIRTKTQKSEGFVDDLPYAQRVAKYLDVNLHIIDAKPNMMQRLPEMIFHLDEPQADPAPINALLISELAQSHGLKGLMSGAGGDDLFTGYRRHAALFYDRYWQWMPAIAKKMLAKTACHLLSKNNFQFMNQPAIRRLAKLFSYTDRDRDDYLISFFYWNTQTLRHRLFSRDLQHSIESEEAGNPLQDSLTKINTTDRINRMLYLELKHFLADHNLNYTDKISMATGIEVRVPLIDKELVQFATCIPSHYKQHNKISKAILKKSMEPYLPKEIIYRSKTGFGAPLRQWLHHDLREMVEHYLSIKTIENRGLFDAEAVQHLITLDRSGKTDAAYTLFSLMSIEIWCQQFIDHATP